LKNIVLLFLLGILMACTTYEEVYRPNPSWTKAVVYDTAEQNPNGKYHIFELVAVDGAAVRTSTTATANASYGHGNRVDLQVLSREVSLGFNTLKIRALVYNAMPIQTLIGGLRSHEVVVTASLQNDGYYFVRGSFSGDEARVWIEDAEGRTVSKPKVALNNQSQ
jgi:hypothetical protein